MVTPGKSKLNAAELRKVYSHLRFFKSKVTGHKSLNVNLSLEFDGIRVGFRLKKGNLTWLRSSWAELRIGGETASVDNLYVGVDVGVGVHVVPVCLNLSLSLCVFFLVELYLRARLSYTCIV